MRLGKRKRPYYRVVAVHSQNARNGEYLEMLGYYHPLEANDLFKIDVEKYNEWIKKGAVASNVVQDIFKKVKRGSTAE